MATEKNKKKKKAYKKPEIKSEKVLDAGLAVSCNGSTTGNRKATTVPAGCAANRLKT